jgi:hypothetical protein
MTPRRNNDQPNTNTIYFLSLPVSTIKQISCPNTLRRKAHQEQTARTHPSKMTTALIN